MIATGVTELSGVVGTRAACAVLAMLVAPVNADPLSAKIR